MNDIQQQRARFHHAKLNLTKLRFLSELQTRMDDGLAPEVTDLYEYVCGKSKHGELPCLINASSYLGAAFMSLVWLNDVLDCRQRGEIREKIDNARFWDQVTPAEGSLNLKRGEKFQTVRNAIAHARVDVTDDGNGMSFVFSDETGHCITLSAEQLGELCDKYIFAVSDLLYPQEPDA